MPRRLPALLLAAAAASACTERKAPTGGSPAEAATAAAARLEAEGRWLEAAEAHRRAALAQPGPGAIAGEPLRRAMMAYLMADRPEDAERLAGDVLARDPGAYEVLFYLGEGQRVLMRYEEAEATLRKLLARDPGHRQGTLSLAHVLSRLGDAAAAASLYEDWLRGAKAGDPRLPLARIDCARALRRLGRERDAACLLARVLEEEPHDPVALAEAAQAFAALGKDDLARGLRKEHAWLFARGHQLSSEDETKIYSTGPSSPGALARKALQEADRRRFIPALAELERIRAAHPADAEIAGALARLSHRLERHAECIAVIESFSAAARKASLPTLPAFRSLQADALLALGRADDARAVLREASAALAAAREQTGQTGQAGQAPQAAVEPRGDPEAEPEAEIHIRAGRSELEPGGDPGLAAVSFERAGRAAPADWRPLEGRARVLLERGDIERGDPRRALEVLAEAERRAPRAEPELRRITAVAKGLAGDLRFAAREIMALIVESPGDIESFRAFERVFGSKRGEPEVERVFAMKHSLEEKLAARAGSVRALSATPLARSAPIHLEIGKLHLAAGEREAALDHLLLAADLDPAGTEALELAIGALDAPGRVFLRLHILRRILHRAPGHPAAREALARGHLELGLPLDLPFDGAGRGSPGSSQ